MEYQVVILPEAEEDLDPLHPEIRKTIIKRIGWLAKNVADVIHHSLVGLPSDLVGLCKLRVGDYRILYWKADSKKEIHIFRVRHRSIVYKRL